MRRTYGLRQDEPDEVPPAVRQRRKYVNTWLAILILVFAMGFIARGIQQYTRSSWLDGVVGILAGLYIALMGGPFLTVTPQPPYRRLKRLFAWLAGVPLALIGLWLIVAGATQVLGNFPR
jgi:hypothetical protein